MLRFLRKSTLCVSETNLAENSQVRMFFFSYLIFLFTLIARFFASIPLNFFFCLFSNFMKPAFLKAIVVVNIFKIFFCDPG